MKRYGKEDVKKIIVEELMKNVARLIIHRLASTVVDYAIMTSDEVTRRKAIQLIVSRKFLVLEANETETETKQPTVKTEKPANQESNNTTQSIEDFLNDDASEDKPVNTLNEITDDSTNKTIPQSIETILVNSDTVERKHIMANMYRFIITGIEKDMMSTGVFQTILYQYLNYCTRHELETMLELCIVPNVMQLQNVKEGSYAIMHALDQCYYKSQLRKLLLKACHHFIVPMSCDKDGYLVVVRFLEVFDDTKQLGQLIIKKLLTNLDILCFHDFGRLVLLHLLCPRDGKHFKEEFNTLCPQQEQIKINIIMITQIPVTEKEFQIKHQNTPGIDFNNPTTWIKLKVSERPSCKKEGVVRRKELLQAFIPGIVKYCRENMKKLLIHALGGTIVIEVLRLLLHGSDLVPKSKELTEQFITSLLKTTLSDTVPKEKSPAPPLPEKPAILQKSSQGVQINDIIRSSLSNLKSGPTHQDDAAETNEEHPQDEKINENIDEEGDQAKPKKTPLTDEEMIASAQYQTEMLQYSVNMHRHKTLNYDYDTSTPVMFHGLGRRRLVKAIEMFEELHSKVCDYIIQMDTSSIISLVESPGVYVFCGLFQHSENESIKSQLQEKLKPILQTVSKKHNKEDLEKQKGL
ncbi:hypothetical protein RFI_09914, partial [Reticulomyxa filosa]